MEVRNVKPYFSSLKLVLHDGVVEVPVQNQQTGQQGIALQNEERQISCNITGWLNNQVVRSDTFKFPHEPVDEPSIDDVLATAKAMGVDVVKAWSDAFNEIANNFPVIADQPAEWANIGPKVYLRPDAFAANLHPTQKKSVVIKVGVYADEAHKKLQTYITLVFEDGETKRERELNIANNKQRKTSAESNLTALNTLISLKEGNQQIPPNTYNQHLVDQTVEQLKTLKPQIEQEIRSLTTAIKDLESVVTGKLSDLLGGNGTDDTPLQSSVKSSVATLCAAILGTLKASNADYKDIDVAKIMSQFTIPSLE